MAAPKGHQHVEAVFVQIAKAANHLDPVDASATGLRHIREGLGFEALVVLLQDEVDHAANGVRAVNGGCAVLEHLNAVYRCHRNRAQVHHTAVETVGSNATAIQEHERVGCALTAQIGGRQTIATATGACGHIGVAGQVVNAVAVDVQHADDLLSGGDALGLQVFGADDLDR